MNHTISPSILFPLHFLAVLLQLLVCQLVKWVGRFWLWWDFGWADWRLMNKQKTITALNSGEEKRQMLASRETAVYRRTVNCYDTGEDLRLRSCRLHVLTILLSDLTRENACITFLIQVFPRQSKLLWWWEKARSQKRHLVSCLNHLLRVGEKRHKLVWILYLDGCASSLSHLLCLQPLSERK